MLKGKRRLVAAVLTALALPALAADAAPKRNPALPSNDDLVHFDYHSPPMPVTLDAMGANQRAFPLFYGAPAAAPGTLIAAAPATVAAPFRNAVPDGLVAMGQPTRHPNGAVVRTYVSVPVPTTPSEPVQAVQTVQTAQTAQTVQTAAPVMPDAPEAHETSVASAYPHADPDAHEAPPTLGVRVDPDTPDTLLAPLPTAMAVATLAMAPAARDGNSTRPARTVAPAMPSIRPAPPAEPARAPEPVPVPEPEPEPVALPEPEPHFPMVVLTPPPLPAAAVQPLTGDVQPTVGLAEFDSAVALDGTPLPPPPPLPELPGRPAAETLAPVAARPDPAQVRADFNRLKAFCEEDSLGSAAEIYARMPDFGQDEEVNRLRADAANLLILGLARSDNLRAARRIYDSVPAEMPGYEANLAKTRGVINLATYYVRAEQFNDAYEVLMDLTKIRDRSSLNSELFRLMARMIPYLDNADETDRAARVYDLLLSEVKTPATASLFSDNIQGVLKYYLHYVDKSENPVARRKRMDFLEHMYSSLAPQRDNADIRILRGTVGMNLADRYAGDPDRAAKFMGN